MDDYKVKYEDLEGIKVTEWMSKTQAEKFFSSLEKPELKAIWAEILYSPVDDPTAPDSEQVIKQFTHKVIEVFGRRVVVP